MLLNPAAGDDQIVLRLSHQAANSGVITASFDLLDNGVVTISRHDTRRRAHLRHRDARQSRRQRELDACGVLGGRYIGSTHYGTLTINQSGGWDYDLANESTQVQALAEGETVIDSFTCR